MPSERKCGSPSSKGHQQKATCEEVQQHRSIPGPSIRTRNESPFQHAALTGSALDTHRRLTPRPRFATMFLKTNSDVAAIIENLFRLRDRVGLPTSTPIGSPTSAKRNNQRGHRMNAPADRDCCYDNEQPSGAIDATPSFPEDSSQRCPFPKQLFRRHWWPPSGYRREQP